MFLPLRFKFVKLQQAKNLPLRHFICKLSFKIWIKLTNLFPRSYQLVEYGTLMEAHSHGQMKLGFVCSEKSSKFKFYIRFSLFDTLSLWCKFSRKHRKQLKISQFSFSESQSKVIVKFSFCIHRKLFLSKTSKRLDKQDRLPQF